SACGALRRHDISWRFWRFAPRWPRALRVLILCLLAIPLYYVSPPRSTVESRRSALSRPVPIPSKGSNSMTMRPGHAGAIGQAAPPAQTQPILGDHPAFTHITTEQGLSDLRVPAIIQDHVGFMWFGTTDGLNRYDGYDVRAYRNDPADPHSLSGN